MGTVTSIRASKAKPLTEAQRNRMANDRADEIIALVGAYLELEEAPTDLHEDIQAFVLANYDADIESGRAL